MYVMIIQNNVNENNRGIYQDTLIYRIDGYDKYKYTTQPSLLSFPPSSLTF